MRLKGKLIKWNAQKAFGFISPFAGGRHIFIHKTAFNNKTRSPRINDVITFEVNKDKDGRYCAENAFYAGEKAQNMKTKRPRNYSLLFAIVFLIAIVISSYTGYMPQFFKYTYLGLSLATFGVYAIDKFKAKRNAWRTPESTLHFLAVLGGWPGAAIAQQLFRHKSSKREFLRMFWITVFINSAVLGWLLSPFGERYMAMLGSLST